MADMAETLDDKKIEQAVKEMMNTYTALSLEKANTLVELNAGKDQVAQMNDKAKDAINMKLKQFLPEGRIQEVRFALIGKVGSGKSSVANTLLGMKPGDENAFEVGAGSKSVTQYVQSKRTTYDNIDVTILDTPGLGDVDRDVDDYTLEVAKLAEKCPDGLDGFLFVYNGADMRYTEEDNSVIDAAKEGLGKKFLEHSTVILTHGNDVIKTGPLSKHLKWEENTQLGKSLYRAVGGKAGQEQPRVIAMENVMDTVYELEQQREQTINYLLNHKHTQPYKEGFERVQDDTAKIVREEQKLSAEDAMEINDVIFEFLAPLQLKELRLLSESKDSMTGTCRAIYNYVELDNIKTTEQVVSKLFNAMLNRWLKMSEEMKELGKWFRFILGGATIGLLGGTMLGLGGAGLGGGMIAASFVRAGIIFAKTASVVGGGVAGVGVGAVAVRGAAAVRKTYDGVRGKVAEYYTGESRETPRQFRNDLG